MSTLLASGKGQELFQALIDIIYPAMCPACQKRSPVWEMSPLCPTCWSLIELLPDYLCQCCGLPIVGLKNFSDPETEDFALCQSCLLERPSFVTARSATLYNRESPVRAIILALKHAKNLSCIRPLLTLMINSIPQHLPRIDNEIVMPVPLHWSRFMERGFNQSALLARLVARQFGLGYIENVLLRSKRTAPQAGDREQRQHNINNAFSVRKPDRIRKQNILLIDDVMTTGATLNECARKLLEAGSGQVRAFTVARVAI